MLAAAGLHVLRFDYSGTGDSEGDSADVSLAQWTRDIATAVEEIRDISGVRRISLVGMRLGAALALRAAGDADIRELVLWEPVVSGTEYLNSLDAVERRRLRFLNFPEPDDGHPNELMGYPFPLQLRAETGDVDLRLESIGHVARVLLIAARWTPLFDELERRLLRDGIESSSVLVEDPVLYEGVGHPGDALLAHNIPARITAHLTRRKV
jgi:pimeloyl-ACP methyl ester carboxylesterase